MTPAKAEPTPTPDTRFYWESAQRGVLALPLCVACGTCFFYPRTHCPGCLSDAVEWIEASGRGMLHTYVICHAPAPGFEDETPYVIAIVELEEGLRMMSGLVDVAPDPDALELDMPLEVLFVTQGQSRIPKFRPARTSR